MNELDILRFACIEHRLKLMDEWVGVMRMRDAHKVIGSNQTPQVLCSILFSSSHGIVLKAVWWGKCVDNGR